MYKILMPVLALLFIAACSQPSKRPSASDTVVADGNIPTRITIKDSGVLIDYTDSKKGDTVLLFVHGWAINKNYFADQVNFFQDRYRVVAVDLPGYGHSGKNRKTWSVKDFGRDLDSVMSELDLNKVILVGHSMSGDIVLNAAVNMPHRVIGLVGVDNFKSVGVPADPKETKDFREAITAMKKNFSAVTSAYFNQALFAKSTDSAFRKRVLTDVTHTDSSIAIATMESQDESEGTDLKAWHKPLYLVNSDYTPTDTSAMHRSGQPFHVEYISGSGHFPMAEQPKLFNQALQRTIYLIGQGIPASR